MQSVSFSTVTAERETWSILACLRHMVPSSPTLHICISACIDHQMCVNQALWRSFQNHTIKPYCYLLLAAFSHDRRVSSGKQCLNGELHYLRDHNLGNTAASLLWINPEGKMRWLNYTWTNTSRRGSHLSKKCPAVIYTPWTKVLE